MKFFDKKEEVLDIELTQYGKHLLSKGKFKPSYYAFFDNNVLYDPEYGGTVYSQNDIDPTIRENTPMLRTQHNFGELDSRTNRTIFQNNTERHFTFTNPIGTSDLISEYSPKWRLDALQGEFKSIASYMSASQQTLRIPQIDIDVEYELALGVAGSPNIIDIDPELSSKIFPDSSYIGVKPDQVLLKILEENTEFKKDNFDIEVYLVEEESSTKIGGVSESTPITVLKQLHFKETHQQVQNGILVDEPTSHVKPTKITPQNVEYYFDIFVDHEIDETILCESASSLKKQDIHLDLDIECPDVSNDSLISGTPYNVVIEEQEVCDTD